jgi:hypothetical protein
MLHLGGHANWYGFWCPGCANHVWREAAPRVGRLLHALGVRGSPSGVAGPITESEIRGFASALDHWSIAEFDDTA